MNRGWKVLEVNSLKEGIDYTSKDIDRVKGQLLTIEKSVNNFSSLDDALTGKGGDAIRAFYKDCHLPFLEYFQESLSEFSEVLSQMSSAVERQEYLIPRKTDLVAQMMRAEAQGEVRGVDGW